MKKSRIFSILICFLLTFSLIGTIPIIADDEWAVSKELFTHTTPDSDDRIMRPPDESYDLGMSQSVNFTWDDAVAVASWKLQDTEIEAIDWFLVSNIYAESGNLPTGSALATSNFIAGSTISATATWYNFTFTTPFLGTENTKYCITLEHYNATGTTGYIGVRLSDFSTDHYTDGRAAREMSTYWELLDSHTDFLLQLYHDSDLIIDEPGVNTTAMGAYCTFSTTITFDIGIDQIYFSTNSTGSWIEYSIGSSPYSSPYAASRSLVLPNEPDIYIEYYFAVLDDATFYNGTTANFTTTYSGGGGLNGWQYRQRFTVSSCSYGGSEYVIYLNVTIGSGTDSGDNVFIDAEKIQADFDDLRFTEIDGTTAIPYVITNRTEGSLADVWVNVGAIGSGDTFYMQYGNPAASDGSDGDDTFLLYDDFNDASFNTAKWDYLEDYAAAYYQEIDGYLELYVDLFGKYNAIISDDTFSGGVALEGEGIVDTISNNGAVRWGVGTYQSGQPYGSTFPRIISANGYLTAHYNHTYYFQDAGGNSGYIDYLIPLDGLQHRWTAFRESSGTVSEVQLMDLDDEWEYHNSTVFTFTDDVRVIWSNLYSYDCFWDWVGLRPYVTDEPVVSSWGTEEQNEFYFVITNRELPLASGLYYCFAKEKFYYFQATFYHPDGYDEFSIYYLHFMDQENNITISYNSNTGAGAIISGDGLIQISNPTAINWVDSRHLNVTWGIYFTEYSQDAEDIDVSLGALLDDNSTMEFFVIASNYFNIYNAGGRTEIVGTSESGRITGGDFFDLWAANGTSATGYIIFRNSIHIKMCPEVNATIGNDGAHRIYYELQWITDDDDDWVTGFYVVFYTSAWYTGSSRWVEYNYQLHANGSTIKTGKWYLYHSPGTAEDERTQQRFYVDLWFNAENFSSTAGIRLNAYFYPMMDSSSNWLRWLTGSNWGPNEQLDKDILLFDSLYDGDGNLMYLSDVKLIRIKCTLQSYTEPSDITTLSDYQIFDVTYSQGYPLKGIQTPQLDATQVPRLEQGGIFGAIWTAISNFAKVLADFFGPVLLTWADILVDWLDTAAGFFGYPQFFSNLFTYLGTLWDGFLEAIVSVGSIMGNGLSFLTEWLSGMLSIINEALLNFISMWQIGVEMIGGGYGVAVDLWETLGISQWITIAIILYPIFLIIYWDMKGTEATISHLKSMIWIPATVFKILAWIISGFITILSAIIEAIPLAE